MLFIKVFCYYIYIFPCLFIIVFPCPYDNQEAVKHHRVSYSHWLVSIGLLAETLVLIIYSSV